VSQQHPSLHGDDEGEIAQRSADGSDGSWWFKEFVHRTPRGQQFDQDALDHTANLAGTVQAAVQNGVHPKAMPEFIGSRPYPGAAGNHILTYAVPAVPSAVDRESQTTITPTQVTVLLEADRPAQDAGPAPS
jgi:hypothetical protein